MQGQGGGGFEVHAEVFEAVGVQVDFGDFGELVQQGEFVDIVIMQIKILQSLQIKVNFIEVVVTRFYYFQVSELIQNVD